MFEHRSNQDDGEAPDSVEDEEQAGSAGEAPDDSEDEEQAGSAGEAPDDSGDEEQAGSAGEAPDDSGDEAKAGLAGETTDDSEDEEQAGPVVETPDDSEDEGQASPDDETPNQISLDEAGLLAIGYARENTGVYGPPYSDLALAWEVISDEEAEGFYNIRVSFSPAQGFKGKPGIEQFFITKTGNVTIRQILEQPTRRNPWIKVLGGVLAAVLVLGTLATAGAFYFGEGEIPYISSGSLPTLPAGDSLVGLTPNLTEPIATLLPSSEIESSAPIPFYSLSLNGVLVLPGQTKVDTGYGMVTLSHPPDITGKYFGDSVVSLAANPNVPGSSMIWGGVDTHGPALATVKMSVDRFVVLKILPPTPETVPTAIPMPTAKPMPPVPTFLPKPMLTGTPPPTATYLPPKAPIPTPSPKGSLVSELGVYRDVHWGTALIPDFGSFHLGQRGFSYSLASGQTGYLQVDDEAEFGPFFADLTSQRWKEGCYVDYRGPVSAEELRDVSNRRLQLANSVRFASRKSNCHGGFLVFSTGNRYGVIDPIEIDVHSRLRINWWLGESGVVDFSMAGLDQP